MQHGPTANLVSGRLVACYQESCDIYQGSWQHLQNTTVRNGLHRSATTEDAVLLIWGCHSNTTELIPVDGSIAQQGPFTVRHGWNHCTIQVSEEIIVVTGGRKSLDFVTQYQLTDGGNETPLTAFGQPQSGHACGVYQDAGIPDIYRIAHWV